MSTRWAGVRCPTRHFLALAAMTPILTDTAPSTVLALPAASPEPAVAFLLAVILQEDIVLPHAVHSGSRITTVSCSGC